MMLLSAPLADSLGKCKRFPVVAHCLPANYKVVVVRLGFRRFSILQCHDREHVFSSPIPYWR